MKKYFITITTALMILFMCGSMSTAEDQQVRLIVTKHFDEVLLDKNIRIDDRTVMEILQAEMPVVTTFVGSFVKEIDGIASVNENGIKKDWFYYINGTLAHVGALAYFPNGGDVIWWDYHQWDEAISIPSIVGAYPEPFRMNYGGKVSPVRIIYAAPYEEEAMLLQNDLKTAGVDRSRIEKYTGSIDGFNEDYIILVGLWDELKNDNLISDMVKHSSKSGILVGFNDKSVILLDVNGKQVDEFTSAGVILAAGSGFQAKPSLWLITATDETSLKQTVNLIVNEPKKLMYHSGIIYSNNVIYNAPAFK